MSFLKKYADYLQRIIERKKLLIHDDIFLSNHCYEHLIVRINQLNNSIFGKDITVENVTPIMFTSNPELIGWSGLSFLFLTENRFFVIDILSLDRSAIFKYPDDPAVHIVEYEYQVYKFIPKVKFIQDCYPFEILYPETCDRPLIFIPPDIDEYYYDLPL